MAKQLKRYVIFFIQPTRLKAGPGKWEPREGERVKRNRQFTVRKAKGPIHAFRLATGWKGKVGATNGYMEQYPVRCLQGYNPWPSGELEELVKATKENPPPPTAYVVPLGKW